MIKLYLLLALTLISFSASSADDYGEDCLGGWHIDSFPSAEEVDRFKDYICVVDTLKELQEEVSLRGSEIAMDNSGVEIISILLSSRLNEVVYLSSGILGELGPAALPAVPAIERAISRIESEESRLWVGPSVSMAYDLYKALNMIDGRPLPEEFRSPDLP